MLAPYSVLQKKYLTLIAKQDDPEFVEKFMLMENWRMDSPKVSGPVLAEFIHIFYRSNAFYNEFIEFKSIKLKMDIKIDVPVLNLYGLKDRLVPPDASRALSGMVTERFLYNEASFDCGHIGMYTMGGEERTPGQVIGLWLDQELF